MPEELPSSGTGIDGDPYILTNIEQVQWIGGDSVGHPLAHRRAAYYELGNDIDASETEEWNWAGTYYQGWIPISGFVGNFDGMDCSITSLYIHQIEDLWKVGLFGTLGQYATIRNVSILNASVTVEKTGVSSSVTDVGVLVGIAQDTNEVLIERVYASGQVSSTFHGSIYMPSAGGLIGSLLRMHHTTVQYCAADVNVTLICTHATDGKGNAGGFIGQHASYHTVIINDCYARGSVSLSVTGSSAGVGGFGGRWPLPTNPLDPKYYRVYATGSVTGSSAGGLVGTVWPVKGVMEDSFWDAKPLA